MNPSTPTALLRIFVSSTDQLNQDLLFESIVISAKNEGIAGATVLKGILGYGASSVIHSNKFWEVTDKLPVVIELIDEEEKIRHFYETIRPQLEAMRNGCLVTIENISVLLFKAGKRK